MAFTDSEIAEAHEAVRKQGDSDNLYKLGLIYSTGQGGAVDYVQAHMWFNLAASQLSASEKEKRDMAVKNRDLIAAKMTPAQLAEAQRLAREWRPKKN